MIQYKQRIDAETIENARRALPDYNEIIAPLLYSRGIRSPEEAQCFLHPSLDQLLDPTLLNDMSKAVSLLKQARKNDDPIVVYGDYDCDGICATALLVSALKAHGYRVKPHTPHRSQGYGLNVLAIEKLAAEGCKLLLTVDLGITNRDEITVARELGMTIIVTDHHTPDPTKICNADAIVNPHMNGYPCPLCGTGVAFKLAMQLFGLQDCLPLLDLAALATVADIVPLRSENRVLVAEGLKVIAAGKRPGIAALLEVAGLHREITCDTLGFQLGPRLNAAGRIGYAGDAVQLMLSETPEEARQLAIALDELNAKRKNLENAVTENAKAMVSSIDFCQDKAIIVKGKGWDAGVVGLAAGKLAQEYSCPACVLTENDDGLLVGSLRSVPGVNIFDCLIAAEQAYVKDTGQDKLYVKRGGHSQAAGATVTPHTYQAFYDLLQTEIRKHPDDCFRPVQEYDMEVELWRCNELLLAEIDRLAPFGCDNPSPRFCVKGASITERRSTSTGEHLQVTLLNEKQGVIKGIAFRMGYLDKQPLTKADLVFALTRNTFRGITTIQMQIDSIEATREERENFALACPPELQQQDLLDSFQALLRFPLLPPFEPQPSTMEEMEEALLSGERGHLFLARCSRTAQQLLKNCRLHGKEIDIVQNVPQAPQCFPTLVTHPQFAEPVGKWRHLWLTDGCLSVAETAIWHKLYPEAEIHTLPASAALLETAAALSNRDALNNAYKAWRRSPADYHSEELMAADLQLSVPQLRLLLMKLSDIKWCAYQPMPFRCTLLPPQKNNLTSPIADTITTYIKQNSPSATVTEEE